MSVLLIYTGRSASIGRGMTVGIAPAPRVATPVATSECGLKPHRIETAYRRKSNSPTLTCFMNSSNPSFTTTCMTRHARIQPWDGMGMPTSYDIPDGLTHRAREHNCCCPGGSHEVSVSVISHLAFACLFSPTIRKKQSHPSCAWPGLWDISIQIVYDTYWVTYLCFWCVQTAFCCL